MRLGKLATMVIWRLEINSENSTSLCNRRSIRNRFTGPVCGHNRHFDFVFFFLFHFSQSTQEQIMIIVKITKTDETIGMDRTVWGGRGAFYITVQGARCLIVHPSIHKVSSFSPSLYLRSAYVDTNLLLHEIHCERIAQALTCNSPPQKEGI